MPFIYTTSAEYRQIEPVLIQKGRAGRLGLQLMPERTTGRARVRWTQRDNFRGLQQMRGLDGGPLRVNKVGARTYEFEPGAYGEFILHNETELTEAAGSRDPNSEPISFDEEIAEDDRQLTNRELDRLEWVAWTMFRNGIISVYKGDTLGYQAQFTLTTSTSGTAWSTVASATPIADFQTIQLLGRGTSNNFGAGALAVMNQTTANRLLANTNASDLGGRRAENGSTFNTFTDVQQFLVAKGLPTIQIYDDGYIDDLGTFQIWIPNNEVLVFGARPNGEPIAEYIMTRNLHAPNQRGRYRMVKNYFDGVNAPKEIPGKIETHHGHNGGPAIYYPSCIVKMLVGTSGA